MRKYYLHLADHFGLMRAKKKKKKKIPQRKLTSVLKMHGIGMLRSSEIHFIRESSNIYKGNVLLLKTKFVLSKIQLRNAFAIKGH